MAPTPSGIWYPANTDAPAGASQMMQLATSVDPLVVHHVTTQAQRDSLYGNLPAGQLVATTQAPYRVWMSQTGAGAWSTLYSDSGWDSSGAGGQNGFSSANGFIGARTIGGWTEVRGNLFYQGSTNIDSTTVGNTGNISDITIATIGTAYTPGSPGSVSTQIGTVAVCPFTTANLLLGAGGSILMTGLGANGILNTGDYVRFNFVFRAGD